MQCKLGAWVVFSAVSLKTATSNGSGGTSEGSARAFTKAAHLSSTSCAGFSARTSMGMPLKFKVTWRLSPRLCEVSFSAACII